MLCVFTYMKYLESQKLEQLGKGGNGQLYCLADMKFLLDTIVLEMIGGGCTTMQMYVSQNCTLKKG